MKLQVKIFESFHGANQDSINAWLLTIDPAQIKEIKAFSPSGGFDVMIFYITD